ncbi:MAG: Kazal-type serine protease inhibitor family protein [Bacteriovoracaceae bacterium]
MKILYFSLVLFTITSVRASETPVKANGDCFCPEIYMPVCGDGKIYGNACFAKCAGAKQVIEGKCEEKRVKPKITPTYRKKK